MIKINSEELIKIDNNELFLTIRERLNFQKKKNVYGEYSQYDGLDFSGYGEGDDRSNEGNLECRLKNYNIIKNKFSDYIPSLTIDNFKLWSWKGSMWWGDQHNWENTFQDFTAWSTDAIIAWIILNKPHQIRMMEELGDEDERCNRLYDKYSNEVCRKITRQDRYEVLKRQKWRCNICGGILRFNIDSQWSGEVAHIDHIHPNTERLTYPNGEENINELENLQGLCPKCNLGKSNKKIN